MEIDTFMTDEIVCPFCGHKHSDNWEWVEIGEGACEECGEDFEVEKNVTVSYTTYKPIAA